MSQGYDQRTLALFQAKLVEARLGAEARLQRNGQPVLVEELSQAEEWPEKRSCIERHNNGRLQAEKELQDIEEALQRIADLSYGICQSCPENILLERLLLIPTAKYCVSCQQKKSARNSHRSARVLSKL